jgi:SAM-dependent methyltransferase
MSRQFEFFDRFTPDYDDTRLAFALDDLRTSEPGTLDVIDVGCGNGSTLAYLAAGHPLRSVTGLDPARSYIDQARTRLDGTFEVGSILDTEGLRHHRGRYDRVVMASVLHHLVGDTRTESRANARQAISHALSLLKEDGKLYLFEPAASPAPAMTALFWAKRLGIRVFGNRRVELGHQWANIGAPLVSYFGHDELIDMLREAGAEVRPVVQHEKRLGPVRQLHAGYIATPRIIFGGYVDTDPHPERHLN